MFALVRFRSQMGEKNQVRICLNFGKLFFMSLYEKKNGSVMGQTILTCIDSKHLTQIHKLSLIPVWIITG